jgi:FSR family fosmidomycin resistance protein-like MFS transporter
LLLTWCGRSSALALAAEAPAQTDSVDLPAAGCGTIAEPNPSSSGRSFAANGRGPAGTQLKDVFRGKVGYTLLLLGVCATRVVPSVGMGRALAFVLDARGGGENVIGATQSVFLLAGGVGMLVTAALLRRGWERGAMLVCPIVGLPLVLLLAAPGIPYWLMVALLVPTGLVLTGTTPAMVSYAHQLLPRGRGLASSITMGLCWGIGGAVVAGLVAWSDRLGSPSMIIGAFAPFLAVSAIGALFLPEPTTEVELPEDEAATVGAAVPARPNMAEVGS